MELYTLHIPSDIKPCRLEALLCRMLPFLPPYAIRDALAKRDVKVNGQRAGKADMAVPDATVCVYVKVQKAKNPIELIDQDERIIVIRKPAGISCEEDPKGGATVRMLTKELLGLQKPPILCHRLDNQTQGLLLLAKDMNTAALLQAAFAVRTIHKQYVCLVKGCPERDSAVMTAYLRKDAKNARVTVRATPFAGAVEIKTGYQVLERGEISRLRIDLITGRTHQIRAHMAFIGSPILGDDAYGDRALNQAMKAKGLKLCACDLRFCLEGELSYLNEKHYTTDPDF